MTIQKQTLFDQGYRACRSYQPVGRAIYEKTDAGPAYEGSEKQKGIDTKSNSFCFDKDY